MHSRVPAVADLSVAEPDKAAVTVLLVTPSELSVSAERSYLTPVYSMCFWVEPSASKDTFISVLVPPQAGLVIVPMMPLPVTSTRENPMQMIVVVTGVTRMAGLAPGVVIKWKTPLDVMV